MPEESIENITKSNNFVAPTFVNHYILPDENINGHYLMNNNISIPKKITDIIYIYIYIFVT